MTYDRSPNRFPGKPLRRTPEPLSYWEEYRQREEREEQREKKEERTRKIIGIISGVVKITVLGGMIYLGLAKGPQLIEQLSAAINTTKTPIPDKLTPAKSFTPLPKETAPSATKTPEPTKSSPSIVSEIVKPTPEASKLPRLDIYPDEDKIEGKFTRREFLNIMLGFRGANMRWGEQTFMQAYLSAEEPRNKLKPEISGLDAYNRAILFSQTWEDLSRELGYPQPNPLIALDKQPKNQRQEYLSQEAICDLGILLEFYGQEVTKENIQFLTDLIQYHLLTGNLGETFFFASGDINTLDFTSSKPTGITPYNVNYNDPRVKLLNATFDLKILFETKKQNYDYFAKARKEPIVLTRINSDELLQRLVNNKRAVLLRGEYGTSQQVKPESLLTGTPDERWAANFGLSPSTASILFQRETGMNLKGGKAVRDAAVKLPDGKYQVTKDVVNSWAPRIPNYLLGQIVDNEPKLRQEIEQSFGNASDVLSKESGRDEVRRLIIKYYPQSEEIQTFFGMWVYDELCRDYGPYLGFQQYNFPISVYSGDGQYGLVDQVMKAGDDKNEAIRKSNLIVEALYKKMRGESVPWLNFEPISMLNYEKGRERFFWRVDIIGKAVIDGKEIPFNFHGAHYSFWLPITQGDSAERVRYAEKIVDDTMRELGSSDPGLRQRLRAQLITEQGQPTGLLNARQTGRGIMDIMNDEGLIK